MSQARWHVLTTAPDLPSAHALVETLMAQGIDSHVVPDSTLLGEAMPAVWWLTQHWRTGRSGSCRRVNSLTRNSPFWPPERCRAMLRRNRSLRSDALWAWPSSNNRIERRVNDKVPSASVSVRGAHADR